MLGTEDEQECNSAIHASEGSGALRVLSLPCPMRHEKPSACPSTGETATTLQDYTQALGLNNSQVGSQHHSMAKCMKRHHPAARLLPALCSWKAKQGALGQQGPSKEFATPDNKDNNPNTVQGGTVFPLHLFKAS